MSRRGESAAAQEGRRDAAPLQLQLFPAPAVEPEPAAAEPRPAAAAGKPTAAGPKSALEDLRRMFEPEGEALSERLGKRLSRLGSLTLTDNRSTVVSARVAGEGRLDVRIQRCFAAAPDDVVAAVAAFLESRKGSPERRRALAAIRDYSAAHGPRPAVRRRRRIVLRPVGAVLDLRQVRERLNRRYFGGELEVHVTWGRAPSRRRRRRRCGFSVRLGTYGDQDKVVRIHRCLDRADVPRYVVEAVVYHEMLHAAVPPEVKNGRRRIHTPEFRRRERLFPHYQRAERWLDRNLKRLV